MALAADKPGCSFAPPFYRQFGISLFAELEYSKKMAALVKNTSEGLEEHAEYACAATSLQPLLRVCGVHVRNVGAVREIIIII
jgi:hypothetical protein